MKKLTRRKFFQGVAATGAAVAAAGRSASPLAARVQTGKRDAGLPVFVATWKQGKPANERAAEVLEAGGSLVDAIEVGINEIELDPDVMTVGYGSIPNEDGVLQLDAILMDGPRHRAGAVAALEKIATPISVARRVMERTHHTMLGGEDALRFALTEGFEPRQLLTPKALEQWEKWRSDPDRRRYWRTSRRPPWSEEEEAADTITMVAVDAHGDVAAGGSTSGLRYKLPGRIGDVPLPGCGVFVDNAVGGAGATGDGDEMMKFCTSAVIVERMRRGLAPQEACESVLRWMIETNPKHRDTDANVYAVSKTGEIGAASIQRTFTYAVWRPGVSEYHTAKKLLEGKQPTDRIEK